jgi:hypothetical protein
MTEQIKERELGWLEKRKLGEFLNVVKKALEEESASRAEYCRRDGGLNYDQVKKVYGCIKWPSFSSPLHASTILIAPGAAILLVNNLSPKEYCEVLDDDYEKLKTCIEKIAKSSHPMDYEVLIFDEPVRSEVAYLICTSPI